jgi:hypothetical protein
MNELGNFIVQIIWGQALIFVFCLEFIRVESPNSFPEKLCSQRFNRIFFIPLFLSFLESNASIRFYFNNFFWYAFKVLLFSVNIHFVKPFLIALGNSKSLLNILFIFIIIMNSVLCQGLFLECGCKYKNFFQDIIISSIIEMFP